MAEQTGPTEDRTWVRRLDGKVVHRATCRYAATGVPWKWGEGLDLVGLVHKFADLKMLSYAHGWLRWCAICIPGGLPTECEDICMDKCIGACGVL